MIEGGSAQNSIFFPKVKVSNAAIVIDSILFEDVEIGRTCHIQNCIIDKNGLLSGEFGMLLGIGANYNFNDKFHLELGYHLTMIENYDYERFVLSYIKHFELDK